MENHTTLVITCLTYRFIVVPLIYLAKVEGCKRTNILSPVQVMFLLLLRSRV